MIDPRFGEERSFHVVLIETCMVVPLPCKWTCLRVSALGIAGGRKEKPHENCVGHSLMAFTNKEVEQITTKGT